MSDEEGEGGSLTYHLPGWIQTRMSLSRIGSDDRNIATIDAAGADEDNGEEGGQGGRIQLVNDDGDDKEEGRGGVRL